MRGDPKKPRDKMMIIDYYQKPSDKVVYPLRFVPHDGYYPLIAIPPTYKGYHNPYFHGSHNRRVRSRLSHLNLNSSGIPFIYKKNRSWGGDFINFFSGFYSVIASPDDFEYMPSSLFGNDKKYRMKGEIDIFCLAVVKTSQLPTITIQSERYYRYAHKRKVMRTELDLNHVTIFVNKEKLRKSIFAKTHYTATVRKNILDQIKKIDIGSTITVKDVSDEYLKSFMVSPKTVRTNSLVETMRIDNEIKDSVFSNLNAELV